MLSGGPSTGPAGEATSPALASNPPPLTFFRWNIWGPSSRFPLISSPKQRRTHSRTHQAISRRDSFQIKRWQRHKDFRILTQTERNFRWHLTFPPRPSLPRRKGIARHGALKMSPSPARPAPAARGARKSEEAPREARRNVRVSHGSATAAAIYKLSLEGPANSSTRLSAAPLLPLVSGAISPNTRMGGKAAIHLHASIAFRITAIYTIACNQGFQVANGDNTYRNCLPKT